MTGLAAISAPITFGVGWLLLGVFFALAAGLLTGRRRSEIAATPESWGRTEDDRRWESEAADARHQELTRIRTAAESWGKSVAALLGVFAVAAFVRGPSSFAEVPADVGASAAVLALAGALAAGAAVWTAALAAQGAPENIYGLDGWAFRSVSATGAQKAARLLNWSRILALTAFIYVFGSTGLVWIDAIDRESTPSLSAIVQPANGAPARCGRLVTANGQLALRLPQDQTTALTGAEKLVVVDECP